MLVGTFPFNSFLAGFMCSLGVFVLTGEMFRAGLKRENLYMALVF